MVSLAGSDTFSVCVCVRASTKWARLRSYSPGQGMVSTMEHFLSVIFLFRACFLYLSFAAFIFCFPLYFQSLLCAATVLVPGGVDYNINVRRARIVFLILFFIIVFFGVEWWTKQPPARLLRSCRLLLWILSFQSANNWISKVVRRTNKTKKVLVKCKSFILI